MKISKHPPPAGDGKIHKVGIYGEKLSVKRENTVDTPQKSGMTSKKQISSGGA